MMLILMLIMMLKYCIKESSLGLQRFPLQPGRCGGTPPISEIVAKSSPIRAAPPPPRPTPHPHCQCNKLLYSPNFYIIIT